MSYLLLALYLLALGAAVVTQQKEVAIALAVIAVVYLVGLLLDVLRVKRALRNILGVEGTRGRVLHERELMTTHGREFARMSQALGYRLEAQSWELQTPPPEISSIDLFGGALGADGAVHEGDQSILLDRLSKEVIRIIRSSFRATACGCFLPLSGPQSGPAGASSPREIGIWTHGVSGAKWEGQILTILESWLDRGEQSGFGMYDSAVDSSLIRDMSAYGFSSYVLLPVEWKYHGSSQPTAIRGAVWLGYQAGQRVLSAELKRARDLVRQVERELNGITLVESLSTKLTEAADTSKQKSDFLNQMSHDIRSPLNNIKAIVTLLGMDRDGTKEGEMLKVAQNNCDALAEIVEDVLDLSRHNVGKLTAHKATIDLVPIARSVCDSFSVTAASKGVRLDFQIDPEIQQLLVTCDKRQARRIVSNLLSNAIKYTAAGRVGLRIRAAGGKVAIEIEDTGCGMSPDQVEQLFRPFTRFEVGDARLAGVDSIGLGLYITRVLAELNDIKLSVRSEQGKGSVFTAELDGEIVAGVEIKPAKPVATSSNRRVLVVDDDADSVESLSRALTSRGWCVEKAYGVDDACRKIQQGCPELVLSDDQMPGGGARQIIKAISAIDGAKPRMAVLSGSDDSRLHELRGLGAQAIFTKPVDLVELDGWLRNG